MDIGVGASIRGALPVDPEGNVLIVQQGNITADGVSGELQRIAYDKFERYELKEGDVLLRSKGSPIVAAEFRKASPMPVIAAASVLVLRPGSNNTALQPSYLTWLLNSAWGRARIQTVTTGTLTAVLPASDLRDLEVPVPTLHQQRLISELTLLARRQQELAGSYREKLDEMLIARALEQSAPETKD